MSDGVMNGLLPRATCDLVGSYREKSEVLAT